MAFRHPVSVRARTCTHAKFAKVLAQEMHKAGTYTKINSYGKRLSYLQHKVQRPGNFALCYSEYEKEVYPESEYFIQKKEKQWVINANIRWLIISPALRNPPATSAQGSKKG